jgi:hypothetical protein
MPAIRIRIHDASRIAYLVAQTERELRIIPIDSAGLRVITLNPTTPFETLATPEEKIRSQFAEAARAFGCGERAASALGIDPVTKSGAHLEEATTEEETSMATAKTPPKKAAPKKKAAAPSSKIVPRPAATKKAAAKPPAKVIEKAKEKAARKKAAEKIPASVVSDASTRTTEEIAPPPGATPREVFVAEWNFNPAASIVEKVREMNAHWQIPPAAAMKRFHRLASELKAVQGVRLRG